MDTSPLEGLGERWPADKAILASAFDALQDVSNHLKIDEHDSQVISQFAADNRFSYAQRPAEPPVRTAEYTPAWIRVPKLLNEPAYAHELTGVIDGYPVLMYLEYVPAAVGGHEDKVQKLAKRSIIRVSLPKVFPQIVLDSNKNDRGLTSSFPNSIQTRQAIRLEGDFSDYFDCFVPLAIQVNALTVLAPNFMQLLMATSAHFDIEFYGAEMILVSRESIYTSKIMAQALLALNTELTYLNRLMTSWNYVPIDRPFDTLTYSTFNGDVVKVGRFRIKPIVLLFMILIGFILFGILITTFK